MLLELADDGFVALLAVDVAEELAVDIVLAFAEMTIGNNHQALAVVIGPAVMQSDVPLQSPFMVVATRCYLLLQLHPLSKERGVIFRRTPTKQRDGIDEEMIVGPETLVQQFHQFSHLPDVVLVNVQAYLNTDTDCGQQADVLQHTLEGIHAPRGVVLHAVVSLLRTVEGNMQIPQLPQILGTLHHVGIEQVAVGIHP